MSAEEKRDMGARINQVKQQMEGRCSTPRRRWRRPMR